VKIGVVSHLFPRKRMLMSGIYVREELDALAGSVDIRLIAPLPNLQWFGELYKEKFQVSSFKFQVSDFKHDDSGQAAIRRTEPVSGVSCTAEYTVVRPFVLAFPRWFLQRLYPASMALSLILSRSFLGECDCIHVHTAFPDVAAVVRTFGNNTPIIGTVHGSDLNYFAMKPSLRPQIVTALNRCARIICVSNSLERTAHELGVRAETTVIPNGIDTSVFRPGEKNDACTRLGLNPARPRVLYAGNFVPVKGIEHLFRAMPHILGRYPECELVLVGASPGTAPRTPYDSLIADVGIGSSVRVVERVERTELPGWIHASDVVAVPSIRKGFGLIAAESLACGRPVVSTRSGGPEDIVEDGQGLLVPPGDSEAFGAALLTVLDGHGINKPEILAESAVRRFSYESVARRILDVYESVTGKKIFRQDLQDSHN